MLREQQEITELTALLRHPDVLKDSVGLSTLTDVPFQTLAIAVSRIIDEPVRSTEGATSFVLHAPLELLARHALHQVRAQEDSRAKERLVALAVRYGALTEPGLSPSLALAAGGCDRLAPAVEHGDLDGAEGAVHLGTLKDVRGCLVDVAANRTAAAGHSNIWVHLHDPTTTGHLAPMARTLARELARDPHARVTLDPSATPHRSLGEALEVVPHVGPPPGRGIAALVSHVHTTAHADLSRFASTVVQNPDARRTLLRAAASQMLAGTDAVVPYGWTHALTLTQAALAAGTIAARPRLALQAAAVYGVAFWAAYGEGKQLPVAAEVVSSADIDWTELVTGAARAHDAHLVKYTVACLQCARQDPPAAKLFYDAAVRLHEWWTEHPPSDDPLVQSGQGAAGGSYFVLKK